MLCLDEITTHKGHGHYRLVISAPELGLVLDILPERSKESLAAWLAARGGTWWAQVEVCCADMWNAYHGVAQTQLPQAPRVVDRFHVMKNLTAAVTKARRSIQKQADQATQAVLKAGRWLLVKNAEHLTAEEGEKLAQMLAVSPELKTCYDLKESCRTWFDTSADRQAADSALLD